MTKMSKLLLFITIFFGGFLYCQNSQAAEYYASPSGSSGTGTKANPWGPSEINWTTLAAANNTLYLFGGTWSSNFSPAHATTSYTLTVRPCSASPDPSSCNSLVTMTGGITAGFNNVTIDGEKTIGSCTGLSLNDTTCRWIKLVNATVDQGWTATGWSNVKIKHLEITGNIDNHGSPAKIIINLMDDYLIGNEIAYNYLHDNQSNIDIACNSKTIGYGNCLVHHNYIEKGGANLLAGVNGSDIYNNYIDTTGMTYWDTGNTGWLYDMFHQYMDTGGDQYIRFYNNDVIGCSESGMYFENGSATGNTSKVRIFNNVFNCNWASNPGIDIRAISIANVLGSGVNDFYVFNNVFANAGNSNTILRLYGTGEVNDTLKGVKVINNIFYNNSYDIGTAGATFPRIASDTATDAILDYNLFYKSGGFTFDWINSAHTAVTTYTSVSNFNTDHATINHNVGGSNPTFTSSTNFRLQAGSPAINAGTDLSALSDMPAGWPFDKDGVTRTGTWDIGAYEYIGASDTTPPAAPSGLTVN